MFRISYLDRNNDIQHKGGFNDTREAMVWANEHPDVTPLKLLVWDEDIECFSVLREF